MFLIPYAFLSLLLLILAVVALFFLIQIGIVVKSFEKLHLSRRAVFILLISSWLGSFINIPIATISAGGISSQTAHIFSPFFDYAVNSGYNIIAINVGGALIPIMISAWLIAKSNIPISKIIIAVLIVGSIMYKLAYPINGVGIAVPMLLPPLIAAVCALIISPKNSAPVAYISGSMGVLIGADLLHIGDSELLGSGVLSIGGAGTFDGIFLAGLVAVILA
ncbi:MAG: DUF1614 domain-containing protein [Epsilonproteobacteria bacterium]|nr:DUF1614 domain-containing protein [Campylobacterota bacterium]